MAFNINEIRQGLIGGGARPTLFHAQVTSPLDIFGSIGGSDGKLAFTCKASHLPSSNKGSIKVPYFGRTVNFAGDRTFNDWTVTIINDEDFSIRSSFEAWSQAINSHVSNIRTLTNYATDANVLQYGKSGEVIRKYTFRNLFPASINQIELGWDKNNTLEEFSVTFHYDWFDVTKS